MAMYDPFLCIVWGDPGIGKSTFANALAKTMRAVVIDKDNLKDVLYPSVVQDFEVVDSASYRCCLDLVRRNLSNGVSVVVDDILNRSWVYEELSEIATTHAKNYYLVHCILESQDVWRERLAQRAANKHAEHRLARYEDVMNWQRSRRREFDRRVGLQFSLTLDGSVTDCLSTFLAIMGNQP